MHLLIQILLWGFIYTAWSMMGRFGFVSLGHGAFMGIGAYVPALLWNYYGVTPWIGIPLGVALAVAARAGHRLSLLPPQGGRALLRAGDAGAEPGGDALDRGGARHHRRLARLDAEGRRPLLVRAAVSRQAHFYAIALALWLRRARRLALIDRGIGREALDAISEDEEAAAAIGIDVMREKLRVTVISAALTALGGAIFGQYLMYLNPETVSGISVSLQIVFAAIVGGMYSVLGPTVGALLTISLNEGLRVGFGTNFIGAANTIYGVLLILCIIFMPRGIVGTLRKVIAREPRTKAAPAE